MKWIHEFYQRNPNDSNGFYYFSQRRAWAILESVKEIKKGYYKAKVVSIESDDEFKVMSLGGGCAHQYYIGEIFYLRQLKNKNCHDWFGDFSSRFWYDPTIPGKSYGERFELIEEKTQSNYG